MDYSLYIHIPFCRHRCAYCDFNTYAGQEDSIPAYVNALTREIELVGSSAPGRLAVHTVFFGGGTPSLLCPRQFRSILDAIRHHFDLADSAEITMEANPGTVSYDALLDLRATGINRISFGAQSANHEELRMLERAHTFPDVIRAVAWSRQAGFNNLNLDLIYGLPEQGLDTWKRTVNRVLDLHPEHLSAYALTLEHGTPFGKWSARGLLPIPDADCAAEMYEWASQAFEQAGYSQYEISNWARAVAPRPLRVGSQEAILACRHNLQYWRCLPYLGLGAGAHSYASGYRYSNVLRIKTYIDRMAGESEFGTGLRSPSGGGAREQKFPLSPAAVNQHRQTVADDISDFMITGLRLTGDGVSLRTFQERFQQDLTDVYGNEVNELTRLGLLEWCNQGAGATGSSNVLRLTTRGRLLGNQVFIRFV